MADIRLDETFLDHPKTHKLKRRLGLEGQSSLITLWIWCAKNRPNGSLAGMDAEDIAIAARWEGDADALVLTLEELRWLDKTDNGYTLHNWKERNPWAADAKNRADKARLSRLASVNPEAYKRYRSEGREGITAQEFFDAKSDKSQRINNATITNRKRTVNESLTTVEQPTTNRLTPAPSPDPSPTPKPRRFSEEGEISDPKEDPPPNPPPVTGGGGACGGAPPSKQSNRRQPKPEPPEFAEFYAAYPRKVARSTALKAWLRIRPDPADVMEGLARWSRVWDSRGEEGRRFIPYPATFLNQERWKECEESDGRRGRSITEHWDSHVDGRWDATNPKWGGRTPTDEELDSVIEQTFGALCNPPVRPGVGNA